MEGDFSDEEEHIMKRVKQINLQLHNIVDRIDALETEHIDDEIMTTLMQKIALAVQRMAALVSKIQDTIEGANFSQNTPTAAV